MLFSFNNNSDYKENESGTKHPFPPSSCSPSRAFFMRTAFSVIAGMIKGKPAIEWLPRLSPQSIGYASSDHYLDGRVARPLNGHHTNRIPIVVEPSERAKPIDPEISVIVSALTLTSRMAGVGRLMCPLNVLCLSVRTYIQAWPVCTHV